MTMLQDRKLVTGHTRNDSDEPVVTSGGLNWEGGNKGAGMMSRFQVD